MVVQEYRFGAECLLRVRLARKLRFCGDL